MWATNPGPRVACQQPSSGIVSQGTEAARITPRSSPPAPRRAERTCETEPEPGLGDPKDYNHVALHAIDGDPDPAPDPERLSAEAPIGGDFDASAV